MKRGVFCVVLILGLIQLGCNKNTSEFGENYKYGAKDSVRVYIEYSLSGINTKSSINEDLVEDVNLYVVNQFGDLAAYNYCSGSMSMDLVVLQNMEYTVYAVANAGRELHATTEEELVAMCYSIENITGLTSENGGVLMCGKTGPQKIFDGQHLVVNLQRCVAKITLNADYELLNSDVDIDVKSVALRNTPNFVKLFGDSKITAGAQVIDGGMHRDLTKQHLQDGVVFYQFENKQGTLQPDNLDYTKKHWPQESLYSKVCSYVEMQATYSSPRKKGDILYRFYLGTDMVANYDVIRNTNHIITVNFKGDGAVDENTWRVDNSEIVDLVTSIEILPANHTFKKLGETLQLSTNIEPVTAADKTVAWSVSDNSIAVVDQYGLVTAVSDGECSVVATSCDGGGVFGYCDIVVNSKVLVESVKISPDSLTVYIGETSSLTGIIEPADATVQSLVWHSSDENVVSVDSCGNVTAKAPGKCFVYATSVDDISKRGVCRVEVKEKEFFMSPSNKDLYMGEMFEIEYTVRPYTIPVFRTTNPNVVVVDKNGKVTAVGPGEAEIKAQANGIECSCVIKVVKPQISFPYTNRVMYDGETAFIPYSVLVPSNAEVKASLSNDNAQIVSQNAQGITIKALKLGVCELIAKVGDVKCSCILDIQKLTITSTHNSFTLYQHFYHDVEYTISPPHAANLDVGIKLDAAVGSWLHSNGGSRLNAWNEVDFANTVYPSESQYYSASLYILGREDVSVDVSFNVKPISIVHEIIAHANIGYKPTIVDLQMDIPQHAHNNQYEYKIYVTDLSYTNDVSAITVDIPKSTLELANPCKSNGSYTLQIDIDGDDGYKMAVNPCTIKVYETVYIVGYSKPYGREMLTNSSVDGVATYAYYNEVVAEFYLHPNSFLSVDNELDLFTPYFYNGVKYSTLHTDMYEEYRFSFRKNESYVYMLDQGSFMFRGNNAPSYYMDFFYLEPEDTHPDVASGSPFLYYYSNTFCSGFSDKLYTWKDIFNYVFKKL